MCFGIISMALLPACILCGSHTRRRLFRFTLLISFYTLLGINASHQTVYTRSGQHGHSQRCRVGVTGSRITPGFQIRRGLSCRNRKNSFSPTWQHDRKSRSESMIPDNNRQTDRRQPLQASVRWWSLGVGDSFGRRSCDVCLSSPCSSTGRRPLAVVPGKSYSTSLSRTSGVY